MVAGQQRRRRDRRAPARPRSRSASVTRAVSGKKAPSLHTPGGVVARRARARRARNRPAARPAPPARRGRGDRGAGRRRRLGEAQRWSGPGGDEIAGVEPEGEPRVAALALGLHLDRDERRVLDRDVELLDRGDQHVAAVGLAAQDGGEQPHHRRRGRSASPGETRCRRARSASRCRRNASGSSCSTGGRRCSADQPRDLGEARAWRDRGAGSIGMGGEVGAARGGVKVRRSRDRAARASRRHRARRAAREQAVALDRAGQAPAAGPLGGEAEEAAVIFGVADQHQAIVAAPRAAAAASACVHQRRPSPPRCRSGSTATGPTITSGTRRAVVAGEAHRPALDRADQRAVLDRGEAQRRRSRGAVAAHPVGGARVAVGPNARSSSASTASRRRRDAAARGRSIARPP